MTIATTLKLPDELKPRIAALAEASGRTPHAWMIEALEAQVVLAEMRNAFTDGAQVAADEIDRGGPLYAAEDVCDYIVARGAGRSPKRPSPVRSAAKRRRVA